MKYFKDAEDNPIVSPEKKDETWTEITYEEVVQLSEAVTSASKASRPELALASLRAKLASTDYKVLSDYDGTCTPELLQQRANWREEIRQLEGGL